MASQEKKPGDTAPQEKKSVGTVQPREKKSPPSLIEKPARGKWGNKVQFILSCIGFTIGLGNVWRFSYLVYDNGGGAFLIPYVIAVVTCGLPLYALELAIGQFGSLGPTRAYGRMAPLFQGLGWGTIIVSFNIAMYYNLIIGWTLHYLFESFRSTLPWDNCNHTWSTYTCGTAVLDKRCRDALNDSGAKYFTRCFRSDELNDQSWDGKCLYGGDGVPVQISDTINSTLAIINRTMPAQDFFRNYILQSPEDGTFSGLAEMNWRMFGCMAAAWMLIFLCLFGGVQTSGKVVYFTAIFPFLVLFCMLIQGAMMDGAGNGVSYYMPLDLSPLGRFKTWRQAAIQVFYSLGPGQGALVTLASYNEFDNNFIRDAITVSIVDFSTSTLAGFTTFSIIGYVAHLMNQTVAQAVKEGPGLAFVVFPQAVAEMRGSSFWSILFFLMLLTLGLDSEFVYIETVTTALLDQFPSLAKRKTTLVASGCFLCFILGLPFCTRAGMKIFTLYNDYSSGYVVMLLTLYQTALVCWVYGLNRFLDDIRRMRGKILGYYWQITWAIVVPLFMIIQIIVTIIQYSPSTVFQKLLPEGAQQYGWFVSSMPMLSLLLFGIYRVYMVWRKKLPWTSLVTPSAHWCPAADLAKRSPARHEGSARLHLLDQPYHAHPPIGDQAETTPSSRLKSGEPGGGHSPSSLIEKQ